MGCSMPQSTWSTERSLARIPTDRWRTSSAPIHRLKPPKEVRTARSAPRRGARLRPFRVAGMRRPERPSRPWSGSEAAFSSEYLALWVNHKMGGEPGWRVWAVAGAGDVLIQAGDRGPQVGVGREERDAVERGRDRQLEIGRVHVLPGRAVAACQGVLGIAHRTEERLVEAAELNRKPLAVEDRDVEQPVLVPHHLEIVREIGGGT